MSSSIIAAFLTGVLGPLTLLFVNHLLEKRKKKQDLIIDALKVSESVNHKLDDIREEYGADRVWITQFHNGGHFYPTGKSIAKFSMVYETVSQNVSSIQSSYQSIPVTLFSKSINYLLRNSVIEIPDFKDETIATHGLKYVAEEAGCKSSYIFAIKTIDNKFVGAMGLDFAKRKVKLDSEAIYHLMNHAASIGGVINMDLTR